MQPEVEKKSLTAKFYIKIFSQRLRLQPELLFLSTPACRTPVAPSLSAGTREASRPAPACPDISESRPTVDLSVFSTVSVPATWPVSERSAVTRVPGPVDLQPSARSSTTTPCVAVSRDTRETPSLAAGGSQHVSTARLFYIQLRVLLACSYC